MRFFLKYNHMELRSMKLKFEGNWNNMHKYLASS